MSRKLESQHRCSKVAIDAVVHGVADILATAGVTLDVSSLDNYKARQALYSSQGIYVPLKEVTLGSGEKAYFIPLKGLLENLLQHPYFAHCFQSKIAMSNSDLLKDFPDGTRLQMHPVRCSHEKNLIVMLLYCDDIELANAIGMKRGLRGKLTVFYVTFVNIKPSERSKVSSIFFLAAGKARDLKSAEKKSRLLDDFITTVNDLENGCELKTLHGEKTFFGLLLAYVGNSLACHNIGVFKESFGKSVRFACRTCMVPTSEFHSIHYEIELPMRTPSQYENGLVLLEKADSKKKIGRNVQHSPASILGRCSRELISFLS